MYGIANLKYVFFGTTAGTPIRREYRTIGGNAAQGRLFKSGKAGSSKRCPELFDKKTSFRLISYNYVCIIYEYFCRPVCG
jgi:hypothetical protein